MKKMLVKAVALSLVLGGVGFVANNAQAADPSPFPSETDLMKANIKANALKIEQIKGDVATNKANITKNAENISDNTIAIQKEAARKGDIADVRFKAGLEKQERENNDKKLSDRIDAEGQARVENDKILNAKIDSNAAKVQEQLDAQDNKNKAQDASIKANGAAIKANKDAIDANAAAIKANKAEADATNQYFNSRIENNTANIDKNKVAIENEVKAREDADNKLNTKIDAETDARKDADNKLRADLNQETIDRVDADNRLQTAIDQKADKTTVAENTAAIESNKAAIAQEKKDREHADQKLQDQITINKGQIENEATNRANEDKRIEAKFDGEVSRLDGRIDQLDANVEKVGAMAAAIANLHTMGYDSEAPTEIAVGVGQYRDKTGLALGAFHYPNRDFMLSFSVSTAGDEFMGGIGATWRFGRKSPEELRQAEVEKAAKAKLAKAEAAKKAAKDARVAAQQKRHAEMLAARTGK